MTKQFRPTLTGWEWVELPGEPANPLPSNISYVVKDTGAIVER